ncbi:hypothetical protein PVK06_016842 [Gossypium arboreum]|uniref:Uncharacterized protein n=1 Tax=Gossypium arboreum TaxID=29729 RepID=A0ABR0Q1W3_GOSAR|nr:hypothetical protein PVK06_016842 [Gossypium arboreum]
MFKDKRQTVPKMISPSRLSALRKKLTALSCTDQLVWGDAQRNAGGYGAGYNSNLPIITKPTGRCLAS